jgi:endonuclease-3
LLVAVLLSAQCTDTRVNQVTPTLFARFRTVAGFARADVTAVERIIRPCGLFRNKARSIVQACREILENHHGQVPGSREALASLPGIGNKSAGVIAMHLSGEKALPVDTHVARLAHRLDLSRSEAPDRIERDLRALLPPELWLTAHHALVWHGRRICIARKPLCPICPVNALCPKRGVRQRRHTAG